MQIYTLKEAARVSKIGITALRKACNEGLIKSVRTPGGNILVSENALQIALDAGLDLSKLPSSKSGGKKSMPQGLKAYQERMQAEKKKQKSA